MSASHASIESAGRIWVLRFGTRDGVYCVRPRSVIRYSTRAWGRSPASAWFNALVFHLQYDQAPVDREGGPARWSVTFAVERTAPALERPAARPHARCQAAQHAHPA